MQVMPWFWIASPKSLANTKPPDFQERLEEYMEKIEQKPAEISEATESKRDEHSASALEILAKDLVTGFVFGGDLFLWALRAF